MVFGLMTPVQTAAGQLSPTEVAAAHSRLQRKIEMDPNVPSMQPGGFVWGAAGERLTPEEMAQRSRVAQGNVAAGMDTSPVASWTQGLARVAQALVGTMQQRRLDRAAVANEADRQSIAGLLATGEQGDPDAYAAHLIAAATNPYIDPATRQTAVAEHDRVLKANAPEYFSSGRDRVRYDPATGETKVVYDGPEDYQAYAQSLGYEPGSEGYNTAAQDYVLRGNGPTAYGFDVGLENARQANRTDLEGIRQGNRLTLRATPTYSDLHPHAARAGSSQPPRAAGTMSATMAPILGKVARGEKLTDAEREAWNMYRPGPRRSVAGILAGGSQPSTTASAIPPAAIRMLQQNPALKAKFEEKYGAGSAARYVK